MLGKLFPCGGGAPIPLGHATLVVGRNPDCDITVPCKTISGRHCELRFHQDAWHVRDLDSKNGISVNGVRCRKKALMPQSVLGLAKHRFTIHYTAAGAAPPPEEEDIFSQSLLEKAGLAKQFAGPDSPRGQSEKEPGERVRYRLDT